MDPSRARIVLGVSDTASPREVRRAYLGLVRDRAGQEDAYHSLLAVPADAIELTAPRPSFRAEEFERLDRVLGPKPRSPLWRALVVALERMRGRER